MNDFYDKLDELYGAGDLAAIETFFREAVNGADADSPECAGLYNELAGFYRGISRFAESEEAFKKSLDLFETLGMCATPAYATVLLNLAGLYRIKGESDKSVELFLAAMKNLEDADARESYAYVSVLNNLALAYQGKGEYAMALEYSEKALAMVRMGVGGENEIAASLNNLAAIHLSLGELSVADSLITESLSIYDAAPEPNVHHAASLCTKAVIQCRTGYHRDALDSFRRALILTKRFFGENIEFAICKRNIADVYEMLGEIPSAVSELTDAVRIMEKLLGPDDLSVQSMQNKLEQLFLKIRDSDPGMR